MENENEMEGGFLPQLYAAYKLTKLIPLRKNFNLSDSAFYKAKGNWEITKITVCRSPVQSFIGTSLNLLTLGAWQKAVSKYGYDRLFHLYLELELRAPIGGKTITAIFEKNETPRVFEKTTPSPSTTECKDIPIKAGLNLTSFVQNTIARMGDDFWRYSALGGNNCQVQIINALGANNLLTSDLQNFILQDVKKIAEELPQYSKSIMQDTTDLARRLRTVTGQGLY
jgi:hypothetical protein